MTNAEARCNKSLRPRKPEGSLGRTAQDVHLDSHTAPELCFFLERAMSLSSQGEPVEMSTSRGFHGEKKVLRARVNFNVYPYPADIDF